MNAPSFETVYRDKLWRFTLSTFKGQERLAIWSHYRDRETGEWKPCGGTREAPGCIIPAERVPELAEALCSMAAQLRCGAAAHS